MSSRRKAVAVAAAAALLAAAGCKTAAMDTERTLAAAGFQLKIASTPEQLAHIESLPQRKLTPTTGPDGENRFIYADAKYCKCLYAGTEKAYDRYRNLEVKQEIAMNEEAASMNWGMYGGWGPWY